MNNQQILNNIKENNVPIILVLCNNSNPDALVADIISTFNKVSLEHGLESYADLLIYDGYNQSIKKENILNIIKQFSYASISDTSYKFYYLKNCENSSKETFNSLLKFLEEPNDKTIGILTTNSLNTLPITIKSRCNIFYLEPDNNSLLNLQQQLNLDHNHWIFKLFNDINELKIFCDSEEFSKMIATHDFFMNPKLDIYKEMFDDFKTWDFSKIKMLINSLLHTSQIHQQNELLSILENMSINPIRPLVFLKIFKIMGGFNV